MASALEPAAARALESSILSMSDITAMSEQENFDICYHFSLIVERIHQA
jgi:hypothetical protein